MYEPVPIQDVFFSDLGAVEEIEGGCLRFYLYVNQVPIGTEGEPEKIVVAKLVTPASMNAVLCCKIMASLGIAAAKVRRMIGLATMH